MVTDRDVYISEEIKKRDAEIERLRAANETWASAYHAEYYVNVRLRAALEQIAEGRVSDHPPTLWAFARAALEGK